MTRLLRQSLAAASFLLFFGAQTVRADDVTLTSGFMERTGRDVRFNLTGPGFLLSGFGDLAGPPGSFTFSFNTVTDATGSVSFNGVSSRSFRGGGSFTNTFISGAVTAYPDLFHTQPPLFSVTFSGNGLLVIDTTGPTVRTFLVGSSAPVPEPATLLLLATGLAGVSLKARRRRG